MRPKVFSENLTLAVPETSSDSEIIKGLDGFVIYQIRKIVKDISDARQDEKSIEEAGDAIELALKAIMYKIIESQGLESLQQVLDTYGLTSSVLEQIGYTIEDYHYDRTRKHSSVVDNKKVKTSPPVYKLDENY